MLKKYKGRLNKRSLEQYLHVSRHGTDIWGRAYNGLAKDGYIGEVGTGKTGDPLVTVLLRDMKFKDDYRLANATLIVDRMIT